MGTPRGLQQEGCEESEGASGSTCLVQLVWIPHQRVLLAIMTMLRPPEASPSAALLAAWPAAESAKINGLFGEQKLLPEQICGLSARATVVSR